MNIPELKLQLLPAANGEITAIISRRDGRELYLHSRFDPGKEAKDLVAKTPMRENTLYLILGCGFGYHIKELLRKIPQSSRIVVIESSAAPLGTTMQQYNQKQGKIWIKDKRLSFVALNDPQIVCFILADSFVKNHLYSLEMLTHIPSSLTDEVFYRQVVELVPNDFPRRLKDYLQTIDTTLESNLVNYWKNLEVTWNNPPIGGFADQWAGKPAIIVSAGPSLTAQLDWLRQAQGKALIICVSTAAKVLIQHGISPDFVMAIDPYGANMAHFEGWDTKSAALLYYQKVWRGIPAMYEGLKFWFTMQGEADIPLIRPFPKGQFNGGGTVAFSALQFARYIKADPIIFVGQDFAFLDGATHAAGTDYNVSFNEETLPEDFFRVQGTNGSMVITNRMYYAYLLFMQEYICRHQDMRYINTSLTGAQIQGTEAMSLEEAVKLFCTDCVNTDKLIQDTWNTYQPIKNEDSVSLLRAWEREIGYFLKPDKAITELAKMVSGFKKMAIYKLQHSDYDELFYMADMKEKWFGEPSRAGVAKRLKAHVDVILQTISQLQKTK